MLQKAHESAGRVTQAPATPVHSEALTADGKKINNSVYF